MFETTQAALVSVQSAHQLLADLRSVYYDAKKLKEKLALYQAGTDVAFNAAINAIFSVQERQELGNMLAEINALITDWETNHRDAIGTALA